MRKAGNKQSDTANASRGNKSNMKSKQKDDLLFSTELQLMKKETANLRQDMNDLKIEIKNLAATISDKVLPTLTDLTNRHHRLELEMEQIKTVLAYMQQMLAEKYQDDLKNDLEIAGVAELENENLGSIVTAFSQKVGVELAESDIAFAVRVGSKIRQKEPLLNANPRAIVVSLLRKVQRDELLRAAKATIVTSEDVVEGPVGIIFFRERLTFENRQLFYLSKERAIQNGFQYCWVRNGYIYVRKADGKSAIRIRNWNDLNNKVGPPQLLDEATVSL